MKRERDWMKQLSDGLNLGDAPLPGVSLVEVTGDGRVLVENHSGVTRYGKERICVKVSYGCVEVCGCELMLAHMTPAQLVIRGRIHSVTLCRGKNNE